MIVVIALVLLVLASFPFLTLPTPGLSENRVKASLPGVPHTFAQAVEIPGALDAYVRDHFPPRMHFIEVLNGARYKLGYSGVSDVVIGRNGWMFYNAQNVNYYHHRGLWRLESGVLHQWMGRMKHHIAHMQANGTAQYYLLAPEKPSIYPEMLPDWWPVAYSNAVDDIIQAAAATSRDRIVFPKAALLNEKAQWPVYGPFDTHWNGYGAYVAYSALMDRIMELHPEVGAPRPISAFNQSAFENDRIPHDLARMLGMGRLVTPDHPTFVTYPEHDPERTQLLDEGTDWWQTRVIETDAPNELTLLLIRDSFSIEMLPFLKAHFRKIVLAHSQFGFVRHDLVERFKPDIAVTEVIESRVVNMF